MIPDLGGVILERRPSRYNSLALVLWASTRWTKKETQALHPKPKNRNENPSVQPRGNFGPSRTFWSVLAKKHGTEEKKATQTLRYLTAVPFPSSCYCFQSDLRRKTSKTTSTMGSIAPSGGSKYALSEAHKDVSIHTNCTSLTHSTRSGDFSDMSSSTDAGEVPGRVWPWDCWDHGMSLPHHPPQ